MSQRKGESRESYNERRRKQWVRPERRQRGLFCKNHPDRQAKYLGLCAPCYDSAKYIKTRPRQLACARLRKTGCTQQRYDQLMMEQNGTCAICGLVFDTRGGKAGWANADHYELGGRKFVRGLLCHKCNVGLGNFNDSPDLLLAAADYLQAHGHRNLPDLMKIGKWVREQIGEIRFWGAN